MIDFEDNYSLYFKEKNLLPLLKRADIPPDCTYIKVERKTLSTFYLWQYHKQSL